MKNALVDSLLPVSPSLRTLLATRKGPSKSEAAYARDAYEHACGRPVQWVHRFIKGF